MTPSDLLERMAATLKTEVGPAVGDEYPRSQAYFSAVVLRKVAAQLRLADAHAAAEERERQALEQDMTRMLVYAGGGQSLDTALAVLIEEGDTGLCRFIEALYGERDTLGEDNFKVLLKRVRIDLRSSVDRRMEYAS